jgi:hypothetical protein
MPISVGFMSDGVREISFFTCMGNGPRCEPYVAGTDEIVSWRAVQHVMPRLVGFRDPVSPWPPIKLDVNSPPPDPLRRGP